MACSIISSEISASFRKEPIQYFDGNKFMQRINQRKNGQVMAVIINVYQTEDNEHLQQKRLMEQLEELTQDMVQQKKNMNK